MAEGSVMTGSEASGSTAAAPAAVKPTKGLRVIVGIALVLGIGGLGYYVTHRGLEDTDDAQIDADVTAIPARTSAVVTAVHFVENQQVKAGDLLVELDPAPTKTRLAQAEADLQASEAQASAADADEAVAELNVKTNKSAAQAQVQGASSSAVGTRQQIAEAEAGVVSAQAAFDKAKLDLDRGKSLLTSGAIAQQQVDSYQTTYNTAQAGLTQAKARLDAMRANTSEAVSQVQFATAKLQQASGTDILIAQAKAKAAAAHAEADTKKAARDTAALEYSYTKIYAPADGVVSKKAVEIGQMTAAGQTVAELVPIAGAWITANFKETQLTNMRVGQPADVEIDVYGGTKLHGEIESISSGTGARFALLPPDNATGNFTKVVQRVPVRVKLNDVPSNISMRPGLSVEVTVDTRK